MAKIGTRIYVYLFCKLIAEDIFGNKYYVSKKTDFENKYKRLVIYNGKDNASKIPPSWHAWIHFLSDAIPTNEQKYKWEKTYEPNLTGTKYAYFPSGHAFSDKKSRDKVMSDCDFWQPK